MAKRSGLVRLVLLRHGESTWNVEGRLQGQVMDVPLTARGRAQALAAAEIVAGLVAPGTPVHASDQLRAADTARVVAAALHTEPTLTPLLREQGLGDLEGRLGSELVALPTPPGAHVSEVRWGGGESVADVHARSLRFLRGLPRDLSAAVIVGHGDSLRILQAAARGVGHREVDYDEVFANCDPVRLDVVLP